MPMSQIAFHHAKPVYEELPGWFEDIGHCKSFEELPANAPGLRTPAGRTVRLFWERIGVGPGRDQNVVRRDPLA